MNIAIFSSLFKNNLSDVKPFIESLKKERFRGKVFFVMYDIIDEDLLLYLKNNNVFLFSSTYSEYINPHIQKFADWSNIIKSEYCDDVDVILAIDIKNTFKTNPGLWIKETIKDYNIISIFKSNEKKECAIEHYNDKLNLELADKINLTSTNIIGTKKYMYKLFTIMIELSKYTKNPLEKIEDDVYNLAIHKIFNKVVKILPNKKSFIR